MSFLSGGSSAAGDAADAQVAAAQAANKTQWKMYNTSRGDSAPWMYYGGAAETEIAKLMGLYSGGTPEQLWPTNLAGEATPVREAEIAKLKEQMKTLQPANYLATDQIVYDPAYAADYGYSQTQPSNVLAAGYDPAERQALQKQLQAIKKMSDAEIWSTYGRKTATVDPKVAQQEAMGRVQFDPGYQFRMQEGNKQILRNAAATGRNQSGATLKALTNYGQGLASQEYGNYYNRLAGLAGSGQTQVNNMNAIGQNTANAVSQNQLAAGQARASGYINQANAKSQGIGNMLNLVGTIGGLGLGAYGSGLFGGSGSQILTPYY